jgi:hypothetical protein
MSDVNKMSEPDIFEGDKVINNTTLTFKLDDDRMSKLCDISLKYECFVISDIFNILIDKEQV